MLTEFVVFILVTATARAGIVDCGSGGCNCPAKKLCTSGDSKNNCAWCCEANENCNSVFHAPADACKSILIDNENCGACGHTCPVNTHCENSMCKPLLATVSVPTLFPVATPPPIATLPPAVPTATPTICSSLVDQILNVTSLYRLQNACDILASTRDGLQNYTNGFKANCSMFTDDASISICNRFNNDPDASSRLGTALFDELNNQTQQCERCLLNPPVTNATVSSAMTFSSLSPMGMDKTNNRNLLQMTPGDSSPSSGARSNCAGVRRCYAACPDCQRYSATCGDIADGESKYSCSATSKAVIELPTIKFVIADLCAGGSLAFCPPPTELGCFAGCNIFFKLIVPKLIGDACNFVQQTVACGELNSKCNTCKAQTGECNSSNSQCCAGETGNRCGAGCCCCGQCYAPKGPTCDCMRDAC